MNKIKQEKRKRKNENIEYTKYVEAIIEKYNFINIENFLLL